MAWFHPNHIKYSEGFSVVQGRLHFSQVLAPLSPGERVQGDHSRHVSQQWHQTCFSPYRVWKTDTIVGWTHKLNLFNSNVQGGGELWKIAMLIFKSGINNQTNRVKYAFESFKYLTLTKAVLSPQLAMKLKWGRFVILRGGANNMECDWQLGSEVRSVRDKLDEMGKNLNPTSTQRIARSSYNTNLLVKNFDYQCQVAPQVLSHRKVSRDMDKYSFNITFSLVSSL